MRKLLAAALALTALPAFGQNIESEATKCWNPPPRFEGEARVTFDVLLSSTGMVEDIKAIEYDPDGDAARDFVLSASRAIELCAPYEGKGVIRMEMQWADGAPIDPFSAAPIDPFKASD